MGEMTWELLCSGVSSVLMDGGMARDWTYGRKSTARTVNSTTSVFEMFLDPTVVGFSAVRIPGSRQSR